MSTVEYPILNHLRATSATATALVKVVNKGLKTVQVCLRTLHDEGRVYVSEWVRSDNGRNWVASYKARSAGCEARDADYPGPRKKHVKVGSLKDLGKPTALNLPLLIANELNLVAIKFSKPQPLEFSYELS